MKKLLLVIMMAVAAITVKAQKYTPKYEGPTDIRAVSGNYFIYFRLADMKEAFLQLPKPVQDKYAEFMDLPVGIKATINLIQGSKAQASIMERMLQRHIGAYLMREGMFYIETKDGKKISALSATSGLIETDEAGFNVIPVTVTDREAKKAVFSGTMDATFK